MTLKLGKRPAAADGRDLRFARYLRAGSLPPHPAHFGHEALVGADWQMLANDQVGDCVFAGAAHETMLWTRAGGSPAGFTDRDVLADYSAVTGYNPVDPASDQGTDVRQALRYRKAKGIRDSGSGRHKIGAYLALTPGNTAQLLEALYLFGAVGIGFSFPASAMGQFDHGRPWAVVKGSPIEGGHYVPLVANRKNLVCVSWGKLQEMTLGFYKAYCDEAWAMVSAEALSGGLSLEGFDLAHLRADLALLGGH